MSLAELEMRAPQTRLIESPPDMKMTAAEFRAWKNRRRYAANDQRVQQRGESGVSQSAEDLCVPKASVSQFLSNYRPVPPDVSRIAAMIDLLDNAAQVPVDELTDADLAVVTHIHGLLSVWSDTPQRTLPEGHWAWQEFRIDRLCRLAAAVQSVTCTTSPKLAKSRKKAAEMVRSWGAAS